MIAIATHAATTSSISISIASKARINTICLPFIRSYGGIYSVMARNPKQHEYGLPHIGHIELGIYASLLVCVLLAVDFVQSLIADTAKA